MKSGVETVWPTPWRQSILRHAAAVSKRLPTIEPINRLSAYLKAPILEEDRRNRETPRSTGQGKASR
jgi:hypothetical protein